MLQVIGVGEHKYEKYGERFIAHIMECTAGKNEKYFFGGQEEAITAAAGSDVTDGSSVAVRKTRVPKADFLITEAMADQIVYTDSSLIADLVNQLNDLRDAESMKKISGAAIVRILLENLYIYEKLTKGIWKKYVTEKGSEAGISIGIRISGKGQEYEDLYYNKSAQQMIVEWLRKSDR
jgi:ATP-dependent DNA helicase RecQ